MTPIAHHDTQLLRLTRGSAYPTDARSYALGGRVEVAGDRVTVTSDLAAVNRLHWAVDRNQLLISADPRLLYRRGMTLDHRGLISLLTLGTIAPPFTLRREVHAFRPGFTTTFDLRNFQVEEEPAIRWSELDKKDQSRSLEWQVDILVAMLDRMLSEVLTESPPYLLFSGGVDSGLLASRLVALGRTDTQLVHFSFGDDSPDTKAAEALSTVLDLPMTTVRRVERSAAELLDRTPFLHQQAFADHSVVPTTALIEHTASIAPRDSLVIDGTGADGAFGLVRKASRYRWFERLVPLSMRRVLAIPYRQFDLWRGESTSEKFFRVLRRAGTMPRAMAAIAMSPMHGIGVRDESGAFPELATEIDAWLDHLAPRDGRTVRIAMADLCLICSGVFAQKDFRGGTDAGMRMAYPYLRQPMIDLALRHACHWPQSGEPKRALKEALLRVAPASAVNRPKTGFVSSKFELFRDPEVLERLAATAERGSSLAGIIEPAVVRTIVADLRAGQTFSPPIYNFMWSAMVAESWVRQLDDAADAARAGLGKTDLDSL